MAAGMRVVRGPDWNLGNADSGEGHVGTVVHDNNNGTYDVVWDMGGKSTCRVGKGGKFDLTLLDNAPAGVKHLSVQCKECKKNTIVGTRWQCIECSDVSLCTLCYFADKHDVKHSFKRINDPDSDGVMVPKRSGSVKTNALGIFPGALVTRGEHWKYHDQDGGAGKKGKVEDIRAFGCDVGSRNAARVRWVTSGEANVYRVGCRGYVDLKCIKESGGFNYYKQHLGVIGQKTETKPESVASVRKRPSSSIRRAASAPRVLQVGDKCVIDMEEAALKEVQKNHGGWSIRMADCIGEVCTVKDFIGDKIIEVEYKDRTYQFYAGAVKKVNDVKVGDIVRVTDDEEKAILLQKNHGGWNSDMKEVRSISVPLLHILLPLTSSTNCKYQQLIYDVFCDIFGHESLNRVGKVVKIDSDGDVAVAFGNQAWVFNPGLLSPAAGQKLDSLKESTRIESDDGGREELADSMMQLLANLIVMGGLVSGNTLTAEQIVVAAGKGEYDEVESIIKRRKDLVNSFFKDFTPLMVAANSGHLGIVELLVENDADVNASNSKGVTALLAALAGKEDECAVYLIEHEADVFVTENNNRTTAHAAAYENQCMALKAVLDAGVDPNKQDSDGDTAIHDAVYKRHDEAVDLLVGHKKINLKLTNKKGFGVLHWAALKGHDFAVDKIVAKDRSLVELAKFDGHTALHIAAVNDHKEIAKILILKGKANVNCRNDKNHTPLILAAHEGYPEMVEILIENGADVMMKDCDGDTPLHVALGGQRQNENDVLVQLLGLRLNPNRQNEERLKIACMLIDNDADSDETNNRGATPIQVCTNDELRQAVRKYMQEKQQTPQAQAAHVLRDLFSELPIPCVVCKDSLANTRLLPCNHKIVCVDCCFEVDECPLCDDPVTDRRDLQGRKIINPCHIQ